jgi:peptide methionine sulfoxide reductase MsrA
MTTLNLLGLNADTLGNHNFDRGQQYRSAIFYHDTSFREPDI